MGTMEPFRIRLDRAFMAYIVYIVSLVFPTVKNIAVYINIT
jgi:hypothetical protein